MLAINGEAGRLSSRNLCIECHHLSVSVCTQEAQSVGISLGLCSALHRLTVGLDQNLSQASPLEA